MLKLHFHDSSGVRWGFKISHDWGAQAVADPGGAAGARPPKGPDFFVLTCKFFETATSGVGAPPPTGNPGSIADRV